MEKEIIIDLCALTQVDLTNGVNIEDITYDERSSYETKKQKKKKKKNLKISDLISVSDDEIDDITEMFDNRQSSIDTVVEELKIDNDNKNTNDVEYRDDETNIQTMVSIMKKHPQISDAIDLEAVSILSTTERQYDGEDEYKHEVTPFYNFKIIESDNIGTPLREIINIISMLIPSPTKYKNIPVNFTDIVFLSDTSIRTILNHEECDEESIPVYVNNISGDKDILNKKFNILNISRCTEISGVYSTSDKSISAMQYINICKLHSMIAMNTKLRKKDL
jgi:hypothetical protein